MSACMDVVDHRCGAISTAIATGAAQLMTTTPLLTTAALERQAPQQVAARAAADVSTAAGITGTTAMDMAEDTVAQGFGEAAVAAAAMAGLPRRRGRRPRQRSTRRGQRSTRTPRRAALSRGRQAGADSGAWRAALAPPMGAVRRRHGARELARWEGATGRCLAAVASASGMKWFRAPSVCDDWLSGNTDQQRIALPRHEQAQVR